jgi:hypothetical protein
MRTLSRLAATFVLALCALAPSALRAQVLDPAFTADYSLLDLGSASGVPSNYGGVFILLGQPNTLYIGGSANNAGGALYAVPITRDSNGLITGIAGPGVRVADAPFNDGGINPDPGGLISYGQWPSNNYAQVNLGTGLVVNTVPLGPFGVASASATAAFIPPGYPGAGGMRIASWSNGEFYNITYSVGAGGIISISAATQVGGSTLPGGPEGWGYVPLGSPDFSAPSMIVSEYSAGSVAVYDMDASGNPIIASRRLFISGLSGAEGAAIDPISGSFIFSTFGGGNHIIVVSGFAPLNPPPPLVTLPVPALSDYALIALVLVMVVAAGAALRRR